MVSLKNCWKSCAARHACARKTVCSTIIKKPGSSAGIAGAKYPIREDIPVMLIDEGDKWISVAVADLPIPAPAG